MKRSVGLILFGIGVALLVMAPVVKFVVAPSLVRAPVDVDVTLKAGGTGFQYLDGTTLKVVPITVDITRHIRGDVAAGNHDVAVYDETLCLTRDDENQHPGCLRNDPRIVANYQDRVAFDRVTGYAVNGTKCGPSGAAECAASVDGQATPHKGLGYKFPMSTEKKDYEYFDTVSKLSWPIVFKGVETREGLQVYRFEQTITDAAAMTSGIYPSLYSNVRTLWVEPTTGAVIHGQEQIDQRLTGLASTQPGAPVRDPALVGKTALKGTLAFTPAADKIQADIARKGISSISAITVTVPLVALILGLVLIVVGLLMVRGGLRSAQHRQRD